MSDYKLPELPSDDELGITDEDRELLEEEVAADDAPELSDAERAALLGDAPAPKGAKAERKTKGWWFGRRARASMPKPAKPKATPPESKAAASKSTTAKSQPSATDEEKAEPSPPKVPEGPRSRWRGPATLAVLIAVAFVGSSRTGLPRPELASAADTLFSSARAVGMLVEIARMPHPPGSPEHARVRQFLMERLRSLGMDPEIQTATAMGQIGGVARGATVRNVVARLPGTASTGAVLITAHYDSRELSPGAADDGAGLVTILEALRALRTGAPLRNDVIVLFTDAEEACLCGAQAFVERHRWIDDVSVVLSFEMRGAGGPSIMFETNDLNGWIVRALQDFDPRPFANSMADEVYQRMPNATDFTEFKEAGKQGLNFAALDRAHIYHQAADRPANLAEETVQHHGLRALAALRYLGESDLAAVDAPDAVYFNVPLLGLVVYDDFWVLPISGGLIALLVLAGLVVRAGGGRASGVAVGVGVAVLGGAGSFGAALWLRGWVLGSYAEGGSLAGSILHSEGWFVLAAAAAAFSCVTAIHGIARRWFTVSELSLGAVLVPLVLAVVVGFVTPLGAMNLQWPVAAALLAGFAVAPLREKTSGIVGWLATVALAVPVLVLLVPVTELVWLAMSAQLIAPLAVLMAVALHLCLPAIDSLRHPNSWWAPLTGVVVVAGSFGMARLAARPSPDRPAPSTLVYVYAHGTGQALWATDPAADPVLDAAAIAWATERAGSPFSRTRDLSDFGYPPGPMPVTDARLITAQPPQVLVLSDSIQGPVRSVVLSVRSRIGAEMLRFQVEPSGRTQLLSMNGAAIAEPTALEWVEHWGEPDSTVVLELQMPAADPIGLNVIEHLMRPRELLGPAPFERPEELAPDVNAMSDRAVFSYSVAAYADPRHAFMPGAPRLPPSPSAPAPAPEPSLSDTVGAGPASTTDTIR